MREMKDSGIEWIGKIPKGWKINKVKYLFSNCKGLSITKENLIENGLPVINYGQIHSKSNSGTNINSDLLRFVNNDYQTFYPQCEVYQYDFVFADTSEDYEGCGNFVYKRDDTILFGGYHTIILHSIHKHDNRYFAYLFKTDCWRKQIREIVSGVKVFSITQKLLCDCSLIIPSEEEQQKIADYLDKKCSEIDSLISDIQQQIETLEEYKRSVITEAVTKGLDPNVEMKDSGIEWIGKIPKGWKISRFKYVIDSLCKGNGITKEDVIINGDIPCVRYGEIYSKYNNSFTSCFSATTEDKVVNKQYFTHGDLLFAGTGELIEEIGKNIVYLGEEKCLAGGDIIVAKHKQNPSFLNYVLNCSYSQQQKSFGKAKLKVVHISAFDIGNIIIALPDLTEQGKIANYLDEMCNEVNAAIKNKKEQIEILEEYKKSLIFECVTGKKEDLTLISKVDLSPIIMIAMVLLAFGEDLRGKVHLQKGVYLCEMILRTRASAQYYRDKFGPYDIELDKYLMKLNKKQWFIINDGDPMKCVRGKKYNEFEEEYKEIISKYIPKIKHIVDFIRDMKSSQAGRISTLYAVWNDFIIDGISNPTEDQIIDEVTTNWTPNKKNSERVTWKNSLDKLKKSGFIPSGFGLHTKKKYK